MRAPAWASGLIVALTFLTVAPSEAQQRPLIFIPGILGSKLCERGTTNVVWGGLDSLRRLSELTLSAGQELGSLRHQPCGVIESIQILGPWRSHQYDDLLAMLERLGYRRDRNLFIFDYDWRLSNHANARLLGEKAKQWVPTGGFDIVAHSMGGLIARIFIQSGDNAKHVERLITMGTPHQGSANVFKTLDGGWGWWQNMLARGLGQIRSTVLTFPSIFELLPAYDRCCFWKESDGAVFAFQPFDVADWQRVSWLPPDMRTPERRVWLAGVLADARRMYELTSQPIPSRIRHVAIVTSLIPTAWRVILERRGETTLSILTWPGDGTVYERSAANRDLQSARASSTEHQRIFADTAAEQVLRWVLKGDSEPTAGRVEDFRARLDTADGRSLKVSTVAYAVDPPILDRNQAATFVVEISGEAALSDADLRNVTVSLIPGPGAVALVRRFDQSAGDRSVSTTLHFSFFAPSTPGSHSVAIRLPGIGQLQDYFLVMPGP